MGGQVKFKLQFRENRTILLFLGQVCFHNFETESLFHLSRGEMKTFLRGKTPYKNFKRQLLYMRYPPLEGLQLQMQYYLPLILCCASLSQKKTNFVQSRPLFSVLK